jgi:hypothetical protein
MIKLNQIIRQIIFYLILFSICLSIILGLWVLLGKPHILSDFFFGKDGNLPNEPYIEFYENGNLKYYSEIKNSKINGEVSYYYENGKKSASGKGKDGLMIGTWQIYDSLGNKFACIDFGYNDTFKPIIKLYIDKDSISYEINNINNDSIWLQNLEDYSPSSIINYLTKIGYKCPEKLINKNKTTSSKDSLIHNIVK